MYISTIFIKTMIRNASFNFPSNFFLFFSYLFKIRNLKNKKLRYYDKIHIILLAVLESKSGFL